MTNAESSMLTEIKVEVAMLKQEVSFINKLFDRMEILIDKVDTQYETLVDKTSRIESNLSYTKDELEELYELLTQTEQRIREKIASVENTLNNDIEEMGERVDVLEVDSKDLLKNRWMLAGGMSAVLWIVSQLDSVKSFLK